MKTKERNDEEKKKKNKKKEETKEIRTEYITEHRLSKNRISYYHIFYISYDCIEKRLIYFLSYILLINNNIVENCLIFIPI